jgi:type IV pilus assembly protein PilE
MKPKGFTLLELLVTLAIIAILAALALPGYGAVMLRAQRNEARLALLLIQHAEEHHFQNFSAYTNALEGALSDGGLGLGARSLHGNYALSVSTNSDGQAYLATARTDSGGRQAADQSCAVFTINAAGQRGAQDVSGQDTAAVCWP